MTVRDQPQTAAEVRAMAEAWYRQQIVRLSQCLGASWPEHQAWIEGYLAEEVRQKLLARGWRLKA